MAVRAKYGCGLQILPADRNLGDAFGVGVPEQRDVKMHGRVRQAPEPLVGPATGALLC